MESDIKGTGYKRRPFWQFAVLYLLIAIVVYGVFYYFFIAGRVRAATTTQTGSTTEVAQRFQDSSDSASAYQIYPGTLSIQATQALSGFTMQTNTMSNGLTVVTLTAQRPEYQSQTYTVKPGYTLYFIDRFPNDDNLSQNSEANIKDDTAVIVNPQDFVVSQ